VHGPQQIVTVHSVDTFKRTLKTFMFAQGFFAFFVFFNYFLAFIFNCITWYPSCVSRT